MASLQAKIDAAKAAVSSISTCTPATVVILKQLLLPEPEPKARPTVRATKTTATAKPKPGAAANKTPSGELLGARERTILATHVINAALKSLAGAAKPPAPSTPSKHGDKPRQSTRGRSLRRSTSAPLSPLQPRMLNRVASSPNVSTKEAKLLPPSQSTGCLATVECARVAFACLRSLKGPVQDGQTDFQLENGMSALVGRLLALGLHDQALKEMRLLKKRLDGSSPKEAPKNTKATSIESGSVAAGVADLIEYRGNITKQSLATVTACQTQVLKLVAATKKPAHIEALLPALQESSPSSPINLLARQARAGDKEASKAARQMASLSQVILSLVPSVSSAEDAVASEPRLSPDPTAVFQLQALAFRTQMRWWKLAGHQGSVDDEILSPLARCMKALVRRQKSDDGPVYRTLTSAFEAIMETIRSDSLEPAVSSQSPLASIYQVLGSTAHAARQYDDAHSWLQSLRSCLCPETDSFVRICSVSARILAAALKKASPDSDVEHLVGQVVAGLDGSLSGTASELNELLDGLSAARRAVVGLLKSVLDPEPTAKPVSEDLVAVSKDFILRFPRFVRRWLGSPPGKEAGTKQVLQFDQRRQTVMQSIGQVLDAALMVLKCSIQAGSSEWQLTDDVLQHCAALLESVSDPAMSAAKAEQLGVYNVKISSLYFSKFLELRKLPQRSKDTNKRLLQALSRSIDAVKDRPLAEREKAQLSTKLELFADLCRETGRGDDAVRTLRSICTSMAEDGVLSDVAVALATHPPALAWAMTEKAASLSRTLRSMAKLDRSCNDWTFFLPETERAAVLEHLMHLSAGTCSSPRQPLGLDDPSLAALLRIYAPDRYPIRRLRVLLHASYQSIGEEASPDELDSQLDQAVLQLQRKDKAEDAALDRFVPHLEAYRGLVSAMAGAGTEPPLSAVGSSITSWKTMSEACQTRDDLYAVIDDPEGLLDQLLSLSQLAGLRGDNALQLSISELSITLARAIGAGPLAAASARDSLVLSHSQLAARYVSIGSYAQAMEALERTGMLVEQNEGISRGIVADFYLSQAEYHAGVGAFEESLNCISKANDICSQPYSTWAQSKSQATATLSMATFLQSTVSLQRGDVQDALAAVKSSVRMLSHDWSRLEADVSAKGAGSGETSISEASSASIQVSRAGGPRFWRLASPLLRSLLHISSVYGHIGMFQETVYYAESARKVAESTQSPLFMAQVSAWIGSVYVKAGMRDEALAAHEQAAKHMPQDACSCRVRVARQVGDFYNAMGDGDKARGFLKVAEDTIHQLSRIGQAATASRECEASGKRPSTTKTRSAAAPKTPRAAKATRSTRTPTAAPRPAKRGRAAARARTPTAPGLPELLPKDVYQSSLMTAVVLSRAVGLVHQEDWLSALATLEQLRGLPKLLGALSQEQVVTATSLIGHSMEQMISDPVFSVVQDSTISFPAVCGGPDRGVPDRAAASVSPARKGRGERRAPAKERGGPAFADALRRAQELLAEAHGSALLGSDSGTVHRISTLLQSTIILLSATSATKARPAVSSGLATVAVDLGRNIAWTREQDTLGPPAGGPTTTTTTTETTAREAARRRGSLDLVTDPARFQDKYVEVIPRDWSVISLSLSDNRHDLCISKLQAGHSPFILRLPLERANCRDADSEVFNFEHGREELHAVIKLANETSHSARDFTAKGERSAWWSERAALDARLRELLTTMETTWLGGFRGIFSQHPRREDLLARFQKSFQKILDGSLPSRSRMRGKKTGKAGGVTLDPRILELFIGLGDPAEADNDYDEALNDLLYFVVDVLQFHGERNAYDEIDFDAMVVETCDALRGYHGAARSGGGREEGAHTVLVLDKALHEFPWESLPCMEGLAVSRVPSLACLRQLLIEAEAEAEAEAGGGQVQGLSQGLGRGRSGHHVSARSGTFILNPSSDLENTQAFFQGAFERQLPSWTGLVRRAPSEADMERALSASDIVLYFGHGSGAQYIRSRTVRRLERCRAAAFLMGCSSAALTAAGDFECHGAAWNYMMAGSPAVVGTLWDVTDRDIDRFAGRAFEEWGLLPGGTFGAARRQRGDGGDEEADGTRESLSLVEAVGRARGACRFRYLNAAAVVVYGIPVYLRGG